MLGGKLFYENSHKNFGTTGNIAYADNNIIYEKTNNNNEDNKANFKTNDFHKTEAVKYIYHIMQMRYTNPCSIKFSLHNSHHQYFMN